MRNSINIFLQRTRPPSKNVVDSLDFSILTQGFDKMTQTSSRLELTHILVEVLENTPKSLISQIVYLTQGKLHPDFMGIEIGMAEKTAAKALEKAFGVEQKRIQDLMQKYGDLGDVAAKLSEKISQQSFFSEKLTVERVYSTLEEIAGTVGKGSSTSRINKLIMLLNSAESLEAKFLIRFVTGKLRLGVADFTVLDALAIAFTQDKKNRNKLENAYNLTSDLGHVAELLAKEGIQSIERVKVTSGKPVRPMLAERMPTSEEIIEQMNHKAAAEYKLDGERVQAHKTRGGTITLFSRRLEQITSQYMDVVEALKQVQAREFIVEGEVVAIDKSGKYLPFQELMHRRRKYGLEKAMKEYPVVINLFDMLLFEGRGMIDEPYVERRKHLETFFQKTQDKKKVMLVPAKIVGDAYVIDSLLEEALSDGSEGIVF